MEIVVPLVIVVVLAIIFLAWFYSKDVRIKRALRKAPRLRIGEFNEGVEGKLIGEVRTLEDFNAPLSGRPCAHYHVKVEHHRSRGKSSHWVTLVEESRSVTFVVDDGSGRAIVEAEQAEIAVVKDAHFKSGTFKDADPTLESYLAAHGHSSTGLLGFNKKIRYREGVIEEGELVSVYGQGSWEKDSTGKRQLIMRSPSEGSLLVSDDPSTVKEG